jgi:hypothetical protein
LISRVVLFSMVATSIFFIVIIASKARLASAPPAASASVSARGVICQDEIGRIHPDFLTLANEAGGDADSVRALLWLFVDEVITGPTSEVFAS